MIDIDQTTRMINEFLATLEIPEQDLEDFSQECWVAILEGNDMKKTIRAKLEGEVIHKRLGI